MAATNHNVVISLEGGDNPTEVFAHDTVFWTAFAGPVGGVTKATVTFTGSEPFTKSLGGTITIEGGGQSDTYTVSTTAKPGAYSYTLVCYGDNESLSYTCEIKVLSGDEVVAVVE